MKMHLRTFLWDFRRKTLRGDSHFCIFSVRMSLILNVDAQQKHTNTGLKIVNRVENISPQGT